MDRDFKQLSVLFSRERKYEITEALWAASKFLLKLKAKYAGQ